MITQGLFDLSACLLYNEYQYHPGQPPIASHLVKAHTGNVPQNVQYGLSPGPCILITFNTYKT